MYKTETHLHTAEVSPCGKVGAGEMIKLYAEAGYSTVFVSDHLKKKTLEAMGDIPWEEKTAKFLSGYETAKAAGEKYGVNVIFSAELLLEESPNHYLLYGIDKSFLDKRRDVFDMSITEFCEYAHAFGVTVVQAHPYRDGKNTPAPVGTVDAIEVHNSNPRHENYTEMAVDFAKRNGISMTAGSDAHRYEDIALTGIITPYEIKSAADYVRALKSGDITIIY